MHEKRGQVTIFIIIAMLIVGAVALVIIFKPDLFSTQVPASIQPAYRNFLACLEDDTLVGISLVESQAGYIELPKYEVGSPYIPFSSQLNFLDNNVPYWYYISGNGMPQEQIPSKTDIESELTNFIIERINKCNFESYYEEGFEITQNEANAEVKINNNDVSVNLKMDLQITKGEETVLIKEHNVAVNSKLGTLYNSARALYEKENKEMFLEEYGIDTLRLYAPVDGVELTCGPKIWNSYDIFSSLQDAIETNTLALSTQSPSSKNGKYFFVDASIPNDARFITSKDWPMSFEVLPSEGEMLIARPVGNQQGLGVIGFCYVPYHFVYNMNYPVLVQVYEGEEVFQFPVAVVVKGNNPRTALDYTNLGETNVELCEYQNSPTAVRIVDNENKAIFADISYECFGESCYIGNTSSGNLNANFPQCANGFINIKAEGFADKKYQYSTIEEGNVEVNMNKLYSQDIKLKIGNENFNGNALIYFTSEENSQIVSYPQQKKVSLSEGNYNVSVYVYKNSSITLPEASHRECITSPSTGILGMFGVTQEDCFNVKTPSQIVSNALIAGGNTEYYMTEGVLKNSQNVEITATEFGIPSSIEQLQNNYYIFETSGLEVSLI